MQNYEVVGASYFAITWFWQMAKISNEYWATNSNWLELHNTKIPPMVARIEMTCVVSLLPHTRVHTAAKLANPNLHANGKLRLANYTLSLLRNYWLANTDLYYSK